MASRNTQRTCNDYHVAWICPVADVELLPARLMLDDEHPTPQYNTEYDENTYICGSISGHAVVIAACPQGETANVNAGRLTGSMFKTFPNIRMAVLVGIGGGMPSPVVSDDPLENIHLGDVVVGWPGDGKPACVYHDRGRSKTGQFEMVGTMRNPDWRLVNALAILATDHELDKTRFDEQIVRLQTHKRKAKFSHPGTEHDKLFRASYHHVGDEKSDCATCDRSELVARPQRSEEDRRKLVFHQGRIASGNSVIRDGELRDSIRARCDGALCVEMEAAGVDVNRQCLVIRGISDYADSHKSDLWRSYAAGMAAAFTRELLCRVQPQAVEIAREVSRALSSPPRFDNKPSPDLSHGSRTAQSKTRIPLLLAKKIQPFSKLLHQEGVVESQEAQHLLNKLASTLKVLSNQQKDVISKSSKGKDDLKFSYEPVSLQELKHVRNIVQSSFNISINKASPRTEVVENTRIITKHNMVEMDVDGFKVQIFLTKRNKSPANPVSSRLAAQNTTTDIIAKIRLIPESKLGTTIVSFIRYQEIPQGLSMLHPTISIGMTLPKDSPVFLAVESGDLETLQHLLAERKCTRWDRDAYGTPLLHYAMEQPSVCKFLIENGADIDELAYDPNYPWRIGSPLSTSKGNDCEVNEFDLRNTLECRKLLFNAGADPTIIDNERSTLLSNLTNIGTVQSLRDVLVLGMPFINLEERDIRGNTALMAVLRNYITERELPAAVKLFIEKGADIHARDTRGRACLHIAIVNARPNLDIGGLLDAVIILIEHDADIFAKEFSGRSIFEDAYKCDHISRWPMGSVRGDLWDAALLRCGLGEHIYPHEERRYHFTKWYTESVFESLWKGYENLCPYPLGTSSPCPIIIMESESESESETEEEEGHDDNDDDHYDNGKDSNEEDSDERNQNDTSGNESSSEEDGDDEDEEVSLQSRRKQQRRDSWQGA